MKTKYGKVLTLIGAAITVSCLTALNGVSARDRTASIDALQNSAIESAMQGAGKQAGTRLVKHVQ